MSCFKTLTNSPGLKTSICRFCTCFGACETSVKMTVTRVHNKRLAEPSLITADDGDAEEIGLRLHQQPCK